MNTVEFSSAPERQGLRFSLRDLVAVAFRRKRAAACCFFGILAGACLAAVLQQTEYRATAKFLVGRERMDPVVSSEQNTPVAVHDEVTEEELNSEIGLLEASDVLRQVVVTCGLDQRTLWTEHIFGRASQERKIAKAVALLASNLTVEPEKKSHLIDVSYTSTDPQLAQRVLQVLGDAYIQKHVAVHTPPGTVQFFDTETEHYKKDLNDAEAQLSAFSQQQNGVAPQVSRDLTLQKLSEFRGALQQTKAEMASNEERIHALEGQTTSTPERLVTSKREVDDAQVLQGLKNTLMQLQLKRTELLTKFQPTYPLVQEADKQIADTQASIASEESKPIREETSDRNPTYAWINEELAKARAEHSGLQARATAQQTTVDKYEAQSRDLEQKGLTQQDLMRTMKSDEETYLLYLRKGQQARMTQALDLTHIVNVAVAEPPTVPSLPSNSRALTLLVGIFVAIAVSVGAVLLLEHFDSSFRTPAEVSSELNIPVLAAVPQSFEVFHGTGMDGGYSSTVPLTSGLRSRS